MKTTKPMLLPAIRPTLSALACSGILLLASVPPASAADAPGAAVEHQQAELQRLRALLGPHGWQVESDDDGSILIFRKPVKVIPASEKEIAPGSNAQQLLLISRLRQAGWQAKQGDGGSLLLHSPEIAPTSAPLVATVAEKKADADGDGIADAMDLCPATGANIAVDAAGCPAGIAVPLQGIGFPSGSANLTGSAKQALQRQAGILSQLSNYRLTIIGHTDSRGRAKSNLRLSQRRARSVRDYLATQGVPKDHLKSEGRGEAEPVADNASAEGRAQNRRVELKIEPL